MPLYRRVGQGGTLMYRKRLWSALLLILLLCCGCGVEEAAVTTEPQPTYTYEEVHRRVAEPYGSGFLWNGKVRQTTVGSHTYELDASLSQDQRAQFIAAQEALCAHLEQQGISTAGLTWRVLPDYVNRTESENGLAYVSFNTLGRWEQILTTLQAVLGDYTNYGYLYALANHTAGELGWVQEETAAAVITDPALLNLVYPCFDEAYTAAEDIAACKSLSLELLAGLDDPYGGEDAFLRARQDYAAAQGLDFAPTYLVFAYNGGSCPLKLRTRYLELFKDSTYGTDQMYEDGYIDTDYMATTASMLHTFEWLDSQLTPLRDTFQVTDEALVPVQLTETLPGGILQNYFQNGGLYTAASGQPRIYATTLTCLAHEYVHHLYWLRSGCGDPDYALWHNETVAHYYSLGKYFEFRRLYASQGDGAILAGIEERIGQPYDEPYDEILFLRACLLLSEESLPYQLKTTFGACSVFGAYFVRTYGEEAFLNSMLFPSKTEEYTGATLDQIVEDWCQDVEQGS